MRKLADKYLGRAVAVTALVAAGVGLWLSPLVDARADAGAAIVTHLEGKASKGANKAGPWTGLAEKAAVGAGQFVKTEPNGRVELTLPDGSVMRVAPDSTFKINAALFPSEGKRDFSVSLFFGSLWSSVKKSVSGDPNYRVETSTAVAGVRGTEWAITVNKDNSVDVLVYDGAVGMKPPIVAQGAAKEEVAWPQEVSEKQWEEIIVQRMQQLHVGADGKPGKPEAIDPKKPDAWRDYNKQRDAGKKK